MYGTGMPDTVIGRNRHWTMTDKPLFTALYRIILTKNAVSEGAQASVVFSSSALKRVYTQCVAGAQRHAGHT